MPRRNTRKRKNALAPVVEEEVPEVSQQEPEDGPSGSGDTVASKIHAIIQDVDRSGAAPNVLVSISGQPVHTLSCR